MTNENKDIISKSQAGPNSLSDFTNKIGEAANEAASFYAFQNYQSRKAPQTLRRQQSDLTLFCEFLCSVGLEVTDLYFSPIQWKKITWGLVEAFINWQLHKGYAVSSTNVRLSTIKTYSRLAMKAGTVSPQEYALIKAIQGYAKKEQRRIDEKRQINRIGHKKEYPVHITKEEAYKLKHNHKNNPQGRRDSLLMCLLLDHGLRVGEIRDLKVMNIDFSQNTLSFFRSKVGKNQTHLLSKDTLKAAKSYMNFGDMPDKGPLLRTSKKNGELGAAGMTERAITQRVKVLGEQYGITGLSAHDCRHYWATTAARMGTDPFTLQEAGGWASLAMPRRYVETNEISNQGIKLE